MIVIMEGSQLCLFKIVNYEENLCVGNIVPSVQEIEMIEKKREAIKLNKFYPFHINISQCDKVVFDYFQNTVKRTTMPNEWMQIFEMHLNVLELFWTAIKRKNLKDEKLHDFLMQRIIKIAPNYIRLFQNSNCPGRNLDLDYKSRANETYGRIMCIAYFCQKSSEMQT